MPRRLVASLCFFALAAVAVSAVAADRILFAHLAPSQAVLYIANADGTGEHALTQPGTLDYNPAWSPRGDWIAFTSERAGSADIFRVHPNGSGLERLTDSPAFDDQAAFSPDATHLVFVSTRAEGYANLWTMDLRGDLATHKATPLTTGKGGDFRPAWSPDGQWIAFSSDRGSDLPDAKGRWEILHLVDIYLIHPDGTGLHRLSEHGNFCGSPSWSADSKSITAYCMTAQQTWDFRARPGEGDDQLVRFDIATGASAPITAPTGIKLSPKVLPGGAIGYLRNGPASPGVFYADGKPGPKGPDVQTPAWSPDGRQIVYARIQRNPPTEPRPAFSRIAAFELYATAALPAVSPDGQHFAATKFGPDGSCVLLVIDDGKPARTIYTTKDFHTQLMLAPQWSPDGKQIVVGIGGFTAFLDFDAGNKKPLTPDNGGAQVAILNADGTGFHIVTSGANNNAFASFGPDGKHIVYRTSGVDGDGLRAMNLDDHTITKITDAYDNFPIWSPRGDVIAFIRRIGHSFNVFTIHPDGTGLKQLTDTRGNDAHLAWSPDGSRLLFTSSRMGFKDEALITGYPQPYGEIFVMNADGTHIEQLTDNQWEDGGPAWQPAKPTRSTATAEAH
jgi:Tol biopolymer transport system component